VGIVYSIGGAGSFRINLSSAAKRRDGQLSARKNNRGERRLGKACEQDVIESDQRNVIGNS